MIELFDWQKPIFDEACAKFQEHRCLINGMPTGTGKTYISAAMLEQIPGRLPALVICPKTVIPAWQRILPKDTFVVNWERLRRLPQFWNPKTCNWTFTDFTPNTVIVDEVHQGCSGVTTKAGFMLAKLAAGKMPLILQSATIADNPLKLRAVGYVLGLHSYSLNDFYNFCRRYGCTNSPFHTGMEFTKSSARAKACLADLQIRMRPKMVFKPIAEIPGFPENRISVELIDIGQETTASIQAALVRIRSLETKGNPLVEMLRLRQIAELGKVPTIVEAIADELEEENSVVVFLNFRESLAAVSQEIKVPHVLIHGDQTASERQDAIDRFQANQVPVCLTMIQAGGVGISLHDVRHERPRTSIINPGFSAPELVQALGRIHRAGGTPSVQRILLAANTIEEKVYRAVSRKISNIHSLTDGDLSWDDA